MRLLLPYPLLYGFYHGLLTDLEEILDLFGPALGRVLCEPIVIGPLFANDEDAREVLHIIELLAGEVLLPLIDHHRLLLVVVSDSVFRDICVCFTDHSDDEVHEHQCQQEVAHEPDEPRKQHQFF